MLTEFWDPISGPIFPNRGDQERFWKITRRFVEELSTALKTPVVNAVRIGLGVALCARCGDLKATGLAAWRGEKGYLTLQHRVKGATGQSGQKGAYGVMLHVFPPPLVPGIQQLCKLNSSTHTQAQAFAAHGLPTLCTGVP